MCASDGHTRSQTAPPVPPGADPARCPLYVIGRHGTRETWPSSLMTFVTDDVFHDAATAAWGAWERVASRRGAQLPSTFSAVRAAHCRLVRATRNVCNRRKQTFREPGPTRTPPHPVSTHGMKYQHVVPYRPSDAQHLGDTHGDTLGYTRIPQLYPPARVKIPTQIQSASRSLAGQNQPRLAPQGSAPRAPNVPPQRRIHFPKNQCSYSDRSSPSWLSARWMSSLHWGHR